MGRTIKDFDVPGGAVSTIRDRLRQWYSQNKFRILDESADGTVRTYDAPELWRNRGRTPGGHLRFASPPGSLVAINVAAAGGSTPTVFAIAVTEATGGVHIHAELFSPTSVESLGGPMELEMINTIWAPAGVQRKQAYVLVTGFEAFVSSLRSPLPSG